LGNGNRIDEECTNCKGTDSGGSTRYTVGRGRKHVKSSVLRQNTNHSKTAKQKQGNRGPAKDASSKKTVTQTERRNPLQRTPKKKTPGKKKKLSKNPPIFRGEET